MQVHRTHSNYMRTRIVYLYHIVVENTNMLWDLAEFSWNQFTVVFMAGVEISWDEFMNYTQVDGDNYYVRYYSILNIHKPFGT